MEQLIEAGDKVRNKYLNGGLEMNVVDVTEIDALCEYFIPIHKKVWFPLKDLELVSKADGSFFG
jgi:hypothetical protein